MLMLLLWSLSKAAECVWEKLREDATLGDRISGEGIALLGVTSLIPPRPSHTSPACLPLARRPSSVPPPDAPLASPTDDLSQTGGWC